MSTSSKVVAWFEIPSVDFDRAVRFYEAALGTPLNRQQFGDQPIAVDETQFDEITKNATVPVLVEHIPLTQ